MSRILSLAATLALAGVASLGSAASAAPLPTSIGSLDRAVPTSTTEVRWRHHWHGGGWGWGWGGYPYRYGAGFGWGWGWPGYYAATPYYYEPPVVYEAAPPVYREPPRGANRQCWVDTDSSRGYGYWRPC